MAAFTKQSFRVFLFVVGVLSVMSLVLLIVGVLLYQNNGQNCETTEATKNVGKLNEDQEKLFNFLKKVKKQYFELNPNKSPYDPESVGSQLIQHYVPYDPSWRAIKKRTDTALKLGKELEEMNLNRAKLRPREKKGYAQLEHYLYSIFGQPYDENYYAGDWMMGPNYFCWQQICDISDSLQHLTDQPFSPKTVQDVERNIEIVKKFKSTIEMYISNMKLGVKTGMVRSAEDCKAGLNAFKQSVPKIVELGKTGVLKEKFGKEFASDKYYQQLSADEKSLFNKKYNMSVKEKLSKIVIDYFGAPVHDFIDFLQNNHSRHCVPSTVASGLGNLPLKRVWYDGNETSENTTQRLPTGEILNGAKSYELILPYFTTTRKYNATNINQLGMNQRELLYKRAIQIASNITNKQNITEAVREFKTDLNHPRHFFNTSVIPDNENDELGGSRCKDMESAKRNCPVRYDAMMRWFKYVQSILARLDTLTVNMFYMSGSRLTTPGCPVKMVAKFNPSSGSQSYSSSASCRRPCHYQLPFFLKLPGPKYNAFSVAGHETRPGHHTQVQGFNEHFSESGNKDLFDWLNSNTYYTAFTEGWALYAENPLLATETDLYDGEPLQEYGMLKWQIWRALRLIIDTGLHARGMTMDEALALFDEFAWDNTDKAYKDTIRYMSDPGQATAYMIGQLAIWSMRNKTENRFKEANITFNEKEFHYQVLSQGSSPIDYLHDYIDDYIECKINPESRDDCQEVLDPVMASKSPKFPPIGTKERWDFIQQYNDMHRVHHD